MKVVVFCGSARKKGNTALLLNTVLNPLAEAGAGTELVELAGTNIRGCKACFICLKKKMVHAQSKRISSMIVLQK